MLSYNEERCEYCQKSINPTTNKIENKKSFFQKALDLLAKSANNKTKIPKIKTYKHQIQEAQYTTVTISQIAEHFNTTASIIIHILMEKGFLEKKGKWWVVTSLGQTQGGIQKYNTKTKQKYVIWEDDILENETLIKEINTPKKKTSYQEKMIKGENYEKFIAQIYRDRGYHITEHGKEKGRQDHGIDLIAKKGKEIILIQCKDWNEKTKWKITHEKIKSFQTDARTFVENKPLLRSCKLTARYIVSGNFMHQSAIKHIEEMQKKGKKIDYEIISYKDN
jgi:Holliday junction resolvase